MKGLYVKDLNLPTTLGNQYNLQNLDFVCQDQEVEAVKEFLPKNTAQKFDSFFTFQADGEYLLILGMEGTFPDFEKPLYRVFGKLSAINNYYGI